MKMQQTGFTLIELVIVIVILGILASFAVPRFADTAVDARKATVNALAGSLRSAAALTKATALARSTAAAGSISLEGQAITLSNYYPNGASISLTLADTSGFTVTGSGSTITTFEKIGATATANCKVTYTNNGTSPPTAVVDDSNC